MQKLNPLLLVQVGPTNKKKDKRNTHTNFEDHQVTVKLSPSMMYQRNVFFTSYNPVTK
jgi:hypothetical protein